MINKQNPANKDLNISSSLSSVKKLDSDTNNHLNTMFKAKTGRPAKMQFTDLIYCLELKRKYSCETWLGLYRCLIDKEKNSEIDFELPDYSNFLKSIKKLIRYLWFLISYQVYINRESFLKQNTRIAFIDSTSLSVCKIIRSNWHKTMKEFAQYSKSTMG